MGRRRLQGPWTEEAVNKYMRTASRCPYCDSDAIESRGGMESCDTVYWTQLVVCDDCNAVWREYLRVVEIEPDTPPHPELPAPPPFNVPRQTTWQEVAAEMERFSDGST